MITKTLTQKDISESKKVCEVYFLHSKVQGEEGQKAVKSRRHPDSSGLREGHSPKG